jgi:hypothetical protein
MSSVDVSTKCPGVERLIGIIPRTVSLSDAAYGRMVTSCRALKALTALLSNGSTK